MSVHVRRANGDVVTDSCDEIRHIVRNLLLKFRPINTVFPNLFWFVTPCYYVM